MKTALVSIVLVTLVVWPFSFISQPSVELDCSSPGLARSNVKAQHNLLTNTVPLIDFETNVEFAAWAPTQRKPNFLRMNGRSSYVSIPSFRYSGNHPITLEAIFTAHGNATQKALIVDCEGGGICIEAKPAPGGLSWFTAVHVGGKYRLAKAKQPTKLKKRTHIAAVYDHPAISLYIDGVLQQKTALSKSARFRPSPLHFMVGANPSRKGQHLYHFNGIIEVARISSASIYQSNFVPPRSLHRLGSTAVLLQMDEGQGEHRYDSSEHSHHGQIHDAKWAVKN